MATETKKSGSTTTANRTTGTAASSTASTATAPKKKGGRMGPSIWTDDRNTALVLAVRVSNVRTPRALVEHLLAQPAFEGISARDLTSAKVRTHYNKLRKRGVDLPELPKANSSSIDVERLNAIGRTGVAAQTGVTASQAHPEPTP